MPQPIVLNELNIDPLYQAVIEKEVKKQLDEFKEKFFEELFSILPSSMISSEQADQIVKKINLKKE